MGRRCGGPIALDLLEPAPRSLLDLIVLAGRDLVGNRLLSDVEARYRCVLASTSLPSGMTASFLDGLCRLDVELILEGELPCGDDPGRNIV